MKLIDEKEVEDAAFVNCSKSGYSDTFAAGKRRGFSEGAAFAEQKLILLIKEAYNQAVKDCNESATAYIAKESVNGCKVAKVNSESILKNLKK